jgi:hypothetical protein
MKQTIEVLGSADKVARKAVGHDGVLRARA